MPWQQIKDGTVLCSSGDFRHVRLIKGGQTLWQFPADQQAVFPTASADGSWVAYHGGALSKGGALLNLPAAFFPEGWLDATTLVGYQDAKGFGSEVGNMATVSVGNCCDLKDLGFKGVFVAALG